MVRADSASRVSACHVDATAGGGHRVGTAASANFEDPPAESAAPMERRSSERRVSFEGLPPHPPTRLPRLAPVARKCACTWLSRAQRTCGLRRMYGAVVLLQASARGHVVRSRISRKEAYLRRIYDAAVLLQSISRRHLARGRCIARSTCQPHRHCDALQHQSMTRWSAWPSLPAPPHRSAPPRRAGRKSPTPRRSPSHSDGWGPAHSRPTKPERLHAADPGEARPACRAARRA